MADNTFNEELLIGAFGTLCDFLVDMQLCARDCPYSGNRNEDGECNAWQVIHDIRNKREITDVQPVNQWISVKERQPDKDDLYLVAVENEICVYIDIADYSNNQWHKHDEVISWQPLPELPKEG